jgi:dihydroorotase
MIVEGRLVNPEGILEGQVRFEDETIVETGRRLGPPDVAFGPECLVFAGMGDIHIHARQDVSGKDMHKETFATAAAAAVHGGVVHVADMPNNPIPPVDDFTYREKADLLTAAGVPVHFTLYAGIGPNTRPLSVPAPYKVYMGPSVGDLFFTSLEQLDDALARYRNCNVSFHCEDPILLERFRGEPTHERRRPPECEMSAVRFALAMIEKYDLVGKLCHFSVGDGLAVVKAARRKGVRVTTEVTPHHLYFDTGRITDANRAWMQMNPPLRSPSDRIALLDALREGAVDYLASDHAPHTVAEKQSARGASGQPHLDTYGPFVTWLIAEQGFTPQQAASFCCAKPGAWAGVFTPLRFGRIDAGYTASLTVLNMKKPHTVRREDLRTRCGWSPFEGTTFPGRVEAVFHRGRRLT